MSDPMTTDKVPNSGTRTPTTPFAILQAATRAVPAVKFALGVAGVISATALVKVFFESVGAALLAGFGMLVLMVLLVLFAAMSGETSRLIVPSMALTWALLVLVIGSSVLILAAAFFDWPKPLPELIKAVTSAQSIETPHIVNRGIKLPNTKDVLGVNSKAVVEHQQPITFVWDGLAQDKEAWVTVYSENTKTYFPQRCMMSTTTWAPELPCTIEIGSASESGTFRILVIEAGDGAKGELSTYIGEPARAGMSQIPNGAVISYTTRVRVLRR